MDVDQELVTWAADAELAGAEPSREYVGKIEISINVKI